MFLAPTGQEQAPVSMRQADDVARLTRRELEILRLVAEGLSNAQLASRLWVTEQTVKFHLSNVYRKLGVAKSHRGEPLGATPRAAPRDRPRRRDGCLGREQD